MSRFLKFVLIFLSLFTSIASANDCTPNLPSSCIPGTVCMSWDEETKKCVETPAHAPIIFNFPFQSNTKTICTHAKGVGSHSWPNAYYALDLATPYEGAPGKIIAAADGIAFVFLSDDGTQCPSPEGTAARANTDDCGRSWGNRVKILHRNGYVSFYVHLAEVTIKSGQRVKAGDLIGTEGWTGAAGHRHLHWSVQKIPGTNIEQWKERIHWDGNSVPFKFRANLNGEDQIIDTANFYCPHAGIGMAPNQPVLSSPMQ